MYIKASDDQDLTWCQAFLKALTASKEVSSKNLSLKRKRRRGFRERTSGMPESRVVSKRSKSNSARSIGNKNASARKKKKAKVRRSSDENV